MFKNEAILVIGAGSIGERHIRNLWQLGYQDIIVYRQRNLPFRDIANAKVTVITNWNEVLQQKPFAAIICTPTSQHLQQSMLCLQSNMHVLVEKPLAAENFNVQELMNTASANNKYLQVAYMLRYHPLIKKIKNLVEENTYGKLINIQTYWAEYLPNWHPWEDYRTTYAAKKELGGGVALTLSHDIDVCSFIANSAVKRFASFPNSQSHLEINTESLFDTTILYENNTIAHVHVNFMQPVNERWYKFIFDRAIAVIDYYTSTLTISTAQERLIEVAEDFERDDMFKQQATDFFSTIAANNYAERTKQNIHQSKTVINICLNEQ